jgi:catalase
VVHARGSDAYGTFIVTADVSPWTRAKFCPPSASAPDPDYGARVAKAVNAKLSSR